MNHIELWKLGTDILLMLSLAYLSIRVVRASGSSVHNGRMIELEATLRALIKEADASGRGLSDTLNKRQQGLERLLVDLEGAEHRVSRIVSSTEDLKSSLEQQASRLQLVQAGVERVVGDAERTRSALVATTAGRTEFAQPAAAAPKVEAAPRIQPRIQQQIEIETVEDEVAAVEVIESPGAPRVHTAETRPAATQSLSRQIEVEAERPAPEPPSFVSSVQNGVPKTTRARERYARMVGSPLQSQVERQVAPKQEPVFNAAEEILRSGETHESPVVTNPESADRRDPRLGVLGGTAPAGSSIRRQVSVL